MIFDTSHSPFDAGAKNGLSHENLARFARSGCDREQVSARAGIFGARDYKSAPNTSGNGTRYDWGQRLSFQGEKCSLMAAASMSPQEVTIVIADDNRDAAQALSRLLQLHGYNIAAAVHDGAEALAAIQRERPTVALLDIGMPGMSGLEVAVRLRDEPSRPYLVAITGWGTEKDKRIALEAGFDEHVSKPVTWEQLQAILSRSQAR